MYLEFCCTILCLDWNPVWKYPFWRSLNQATVNTNTTQVFSAWLTWLGRRVTRTEKVKNCWSRKYLVTGCSLWLWLFVSASPFVQLARFSEIGCKKNLEDLLRKMDGQWKLLPTNLAFPSKINQLPFVHLIWPWTTSTLDLELLKVVPRLLSAWKARKHLSTSKSWRISLDINFPLSRLHHRRLQWVESRSVLRNRVKHMK